MNKKLLIGIIATAGVLLIGTLIVLLVVMFNQDNSTDGVAGNANATSDGTNGNSDSTNSNATSNDGQNINSTDFEPSGDIIVSNERTSITRAATFFTERFSSFSSDNNFDNIEALRTVMTDAMNEQANSLAERDVSSNNEFYSIETQVVTVSITDYAEGSTGATVIVDTRRTEQKGISKPVVFSQSARLQMKKFDGQWKTDSFKWL